MAEASWQGALPSPPGVLPSPPGPLSHAVGEGEEEAEGSGAHVPHTKPRTPRNPSPFFLPLSHSVGEGAGGRGHGGEGTSNVKT